MQLMNLEIFDIRSFTPESYAAALASFPAERQAEICSSARQKPPLLRVAGELLARRMLAEATGAVPESIIIKREALGKPYAENLDIHFSISHHRHYAVCAVHSSPIGIDIQRIDGVRELVLKRVYSEDEQHYVLSSPELQAERFTRLWCMKEAYTKLRGESIMKRGGFFCKFEEGEPISEYVNFSFVFPFAPPGYIISACL